MLYSLRTFYCILVYYAATMVMAKKTTAFGTRGRRSESEDSRDDDVEVLGPIEDDVRARRKRGSVISVCVYDVVSEGQRV